MKICDKPHNHTAGIKFTLPFLHKSDPLSVIMKDDESHNIPIIHHAPPPRCPWRKLIPTEFLKNYWILAIDDDEHVTAQGAQETLAFLRSKDRTKCAIHLHKCTAFNITLLNEYCSTFDQFEKSHPAII